MLDKAHELFRSWYYHLFLSMVWFAAYWRFANKEWYSVMIIAGILGVGHLILFFDFLHSGSEKTNEK